jgi:N-acetyl-anhydromuramoyl-L-alanine amidase
MIDLPGEPLRIPRFVLDIGGVAGGARYVPSPHHDERPEDAGIDLLVIHNISLPPGEFGGREVEDFFLGRLHPGAHPYFAGIAAMRVSAHFFVRRDGEVVQFVPCELRAWHAGASTWQGRERCNDFSIGIEMEGTDYGPYEDAQYEALGQLTQAIFERYGELALAGHSDIAPDRKTDPGPHFDWVRYRALVGAA